jgi:hypothetical protein
MFEAEKVRMFNEQVTAEKGPQRGLPFRVARWFVFKPKIQIWVNFGGSCTGRCWYVLRTFGSFYSLLLYFRTCGIVRGNLLYFSRLGILYREKSGNHATLTLHAPRRAVKERKNLQNFISLFNTQCN